MTLDRQGRLFRRINLLDLVLLFFLLSMGSTAWYAIRVSRHQSLEIFNAEPKRIVAGSGKSFTLKGTGFDQWTTIRLGDYPNSRCSFINESTIALEITKEYEPGLYRVIVHDRRGRYAVLPNALEVVWIPQIKEVQPKHIYAIGREGTHLKIFGEFFTNPCSVRVEDRVFSIVGRPAPDHIEAEWTGKDPLPLGNLSVTVTVAGGQSITLKQGIVVLPVPEITSIEPAQVASGDTVDLQILGNYFHPDTVVDLVLNSNRYVVGKANYLNDQWLKIHFRAGVSMSGWYDLGLRTADAPEVVYRRAAINIRPFVPVWMVADIALDKKLEREALRVLKQFPEWQWKRQNRKLGIPWRQRILNSERLILEVALPAMLRVEGKKRIYSYKGSPLEIGRKIEFDIHGQNFSGILVAEPFSIFADDIPR